MEKQELIKAFEYLECLNVGDFILYNDLELFDKKTRQSITFNTIDEAYEDERIHDTLRKIKVEFVMNGGRGASGQRLGGGFGSFGADGDEPDRSYDSFPAHFNDGKKRQSVEKVIQKFIDRYGGADREYAVIVDTQGYTHRYRIGNAHSVTINSNLKNHTIIHNHPSGGNFSGADLFAIASFKDAKTIVATNDKTAYRLTKSDKFNAKAFTKGIFTAKWPKNLDYNKGVDWWLKKNAKKYGYTYENK